MLCQEELVDRGKIAEMARSSGLNVSVRTLRFWASRRLIPQPIIVHKKACYPISILESLRRIEALRPKTIEQIKEMAWDSDHFHHTVRADGDTLVVTFRPKSMSARRCNDGLEGLSQ